MARVDRPGAAAEEAWRTLLVSHTVLVERLDADLRAAHDLPLEWYDVLYQLAEAGGRRTMGDLAGVLLIGASRCTRRVDRMQEAGLVERRRRPEDSRVVEAVLTAGGRARQRRAAATHLRGIQQHFGRFLGDDEAATMVDVLRAAVASAGDEGERRA